MLIEPIQGEAGIYPVSDEALLAAREACDEVGALLIFDEIQTGMGRTGSLWAYEQTPVRPDVLTSAKALGGGLPIGACVTDAGGRRGARARATTARPSPAAPVACAAALAVLEIVDDPALLRGVRELGAQLREGLLALDGVREVRGRGLMLGVGLEDGHRRGGGRRRPARARPDRQRARARHAAPAAAADGRFEPRSSGPSPDRRIRSPKRSQSRLRPDDSALDR